MRRVLTVLVTALTLAATALGFSPAVADHEHPLTPQSSTSGISPDPMVTDGVGKWTHLRNFRANPGTDLEIFKKRRTWYASSGTLGQADAEHVGQRVIRLRERRKVDVDWVFDHASANCPTANPAGTTGLQHDVQVTPRRNPQLILDATDASGRCHDPGGGGLELIDISKLGRRPSYKPREIHLIRFAGTSHNNTVDATRPWLVYNSSSDFAGRPWIDVADISSCLNVGGGRNRKRNRCRPEVYRLPFVNPDWTRQEIDGELQPGSEAACHDISVSPGRIYCAALNATVVFDVSNIVKRDGTVRGDPLACAVVDGTLTKAKVTDCSGDNDLAGPRLKGWRFLGTFNHPGRDCAPTAGAQTNCNSNTEVPSREGVAVAHEADATPDGNFLFVTDERGGGVVPGGATCTAGVENPYGNGGLHVLDIRDFDNIHYELLPDGSKAVFIGKPLVTQSTFCTMHVIEHIPNEQRLIMGYYSQGIKIVDYWRDGSGRWLFRETASLVLANAQTWAVEDFRIRTHKDGTRTYHFVASDITRGIDIVKWRGPTNPIGSSPPPEVVAASRAPASAGLGWPALGLVPLGILALRRRRQSAAS